MSLMFQPLKKYAEFTGRARRSEYWLFTLFIIIVEVVYFAIVSVAGGAGGGEYGRMNGLGIAVSALYGIFILAILVPSIAVAFRRLHDTDRSAWWLLIAFLPFIGGLVLLVFYLLPGTTGPNKFGPDPKAPATGDAAAVFS
jgi:uncharacterized membrane protein YhaH (DUF805 family)